jgi:predicted amidophosphoribosyltransferase
MACGNFSPAAGKTICKNCFSHFLDTRSFTGCARCGKLQCVACEELSDFHSVESLFRLDNSNAELLVRAKDHNDTESQWLLEDICLFATQKRVLESVKGKDLSHIVISPLRKKRLIESNWHPAHMLSKACEKMPARLLIPTIGGVERQAAFSAEERTRRAQKPILVYPSRRLLETEKVSGVLFLDDVLTTGGSALRTKKLLPKNFENEPWHILTIFRSPRHDS